MTDEQEIKERGANATWYCKVLNSWADIVFLDHEFFLTSYSYCLSSFKKLEKNWFNYLLLYDFSLKREMESIPIFPIFHICTLI